MIPKLIHQTWKTDQVPEHWKESHETWKALGYDYKLWTDAMNRELIATDYPWFLEQYDGYKYGIQRADAVRYFILHKYGGIYSDLDLVPTEFFRTVFDGTYHQLNGVVLSDSWSQSIRRERFTNALMMSEAGSDFWPLVWKMMQTSVAKRKGVMRGLLSDTFYYWHILFSTGPGVINDAFLEYANEHKVHVFPSSYVYPHHVDRSARGTQPAITSLKGSSWYKKGDQNWINLGKAWTYRDYFTIPMTVLAVALVIVLIVLAAKGRIV